jgi:excisionase family DNA binding protein
MSETLLTVRELAERLGVSESTIYHWHTNGTGPPRLKLGLQVLYRWSDVMQWAADRAKNGAGQRAMRGGGDAA